MDHLNNIDGSRKNPQSDVKQKSNHYNNPNQNSNISKKGMGSGDSIVKYLRSDELSSSDKSISIMKHSGCSSEDMVDYVKHVARKKPDTLIIHVGKNDLAKGVNTMKVRKCVEVIRALDNTENIQVGFSSIIQRTDKDFRNEIKETNIKLKNYCLDKGFIFVDSDNINESCLNNSKLHLNKKGTQRLAKNILSSLDNI